MPDQKASLKAAAILAAVIILLTLLISVALFEAEPAALIRNAAVAAAVFVIAYIVWIKLNKEYEKSFRFGLGR